MRKTPKPLILFSLVFSACTAQMPAQNPALQLSLIHQRDDIFYAPDALLKTVNTFIGPGGGGPTHPLVQISEDFATPTSSSSTPIKRKYGHQTGIALNSQYALTPRLSLTGGAAFTVGKAYYLLPQGAGILVQPIHIRMTTAAGEIRTGLRYEIPASDRILTRLSVDVGLRGAITRTKIDSPVVAMHHTSHTAIPFIGTGFGLTYRHGPKGRKLVLSSQIRKYRDTGVTVSSGLSLEY